MSVPLLVWTTFGGRRHRSFRYHRSTFHFPFVLSCFPSHLVSILSITCCVFNPLFPICHCPVLLIVRVCAGYVWRAKGFVLLYLFICVFLLLNCTVVTVFSLLRLTSLPPVRTRYNGLRFSSCSDLKKMVENMQPKSNESG
jgi:hypothetical protein